jgi:hypothetical protein
MVKVSIEVRSGATHFDVGVQAESVQRVMSLVRERYPEGSVKAKFPIESQSFFVEDPSAPTGIVGLELPARVAA